MSFISYAQNFEDVMLWRALKHVKHGFYIDVGANDPTLYSVTRAFYDRGWHGINAEPVKSFFDKLQIERPRDTNIQVAVGASNGFLDFFDIPDSGLATTELAVAEMHRSNGFEVKTIKVPVVPLTEICREHLVNDIHFLKIDVEGAELQVLLGMDFLQYRPWIVIVEATIPMSQETVHGKWEYILTNSNYNFCYFDGLNRYYVAAERSELAVAFSVPPNVFDDFVLNTDQESRLRADEACARAYQSQLRAQQAETKAQQAETKAQQAETKAQQAEAKAQLAEAKAQLAEAKAQLAETGLDAVYNSHSWRVTKPLRLAGKAVRWFVPGSVAWLTFAPMSRPRRALKSQLISLKDKINTNPQLKAFTVRLLSRFPRFKARLRYIGNPRCVMSTVSSVEGPEQLSPRGRQIYLDLKEAIEQHQKENY